MTRYVTVTPKAAQLCDLGYRIANRAQRRSAARGGVHAAPMFTRSHSPWPALAAAVAVLAGCGTKGGPPPPPQVALVASSAGFGDGGFNDDARAALEACKQQTIVVTASAAPSGNAEIEPKLILYATEKFDTVIAIGYAAAPAVAAVARRFDGTHFALIDAVASAPNIQSITFNEAQGAFLAGALAALVSKTHRIAFIGGADVPLLRRSEAGFRAGARAADPRAHVAIRYLGTFADAARGAAAARGLLAAGSDVVYVVAGPAGLGAIRAIAGSPHGYAIGADTDEDAIAPGRVLASVTKHVGTAAGIVCSETTGGKPEIGHRVLGIAEGGIGLTPFTYTKAVIGAATIARLHALARAVVDGRIAVPAQP